MKPYHITNAPDFELWRSPAAQMIGDLAQKSSLFLTHFEYRNHLSIPLHWMPDHRPDLDGEVRWKNGQLKEHKYLHFRYDQCLGSFHPGHRAKWTAHELCHTLVGFAWNPTMTPLMHSLVARTAELLPVALWYFFDEVQLRRCEIHEGGGTLFQEYCRDCEKLAKSPRLFEDYDQKHIENGIKFVKDELSAVAKSRRFSKPISHLYATLDLSSDALAYVSMHHHRYQDPYFRAFLERFHGAHTGMWLDLDELEDRVVSICNHLSGGLAPNPLAGKRSDYIAQDIAWRFFTVASQCEDMEAIEALEGLVDQLADQPEDLVSIVNQYQSLCEEWTLPDPMQMFAVGYDLGNGLNLGWDVYQACEGIKSACPWTAKVLGEEGLYEQVNAFCAWDLQNPQRVPIAKRFAQFLANTASGPLSDLVHYEAGLMHPEPPDTMGISLGWTEPEGDLVKRANGTEILHLSVDIDRLIEAIQIEEEKGEEIDVPERDYHLLMINQAGGEMLVLEISKEASQALERLEAQPMAEDLLGLEQEEIDMLKRAMAIIPCHWRLNASEVEDQDQDQDENAEDQDENGEE
jgi:hypothetical protein